MKENNSNVAMEEILQLSNLLYSQTTNILDKFNFSLLEDKYDKYQTDINLFLQIMTYVYGKINTRVAEEFPEERFTFNFPIYTNLLGTKIFNFYSNYMNIEIQNMSSSENMHCISELFHLFRKDNNVIKLDVFNQNHSPELVIEILKEITSIMEQSVQFYNGISLTMSSEGNKDQINQYLGSIKEHPELLSLNLIFAPLDMKSHIIEYMMKSNIGFKIDDIFRDLLLIGERLNNVNIYDDELKKVKARFFSKFEDISSVRKEFEIIELNTKLKIGLNINQDTKNNKAKI